MKTGIKPKHLMRYVIKPTLSFLEKDGDAARLLILCTAAVETRLGHYLKQKNDGVACGIYQMEPNTHLDIYDRVLSYHPFLNEKINQLSRFDSIEHRERELITNLEYATAMTRLQYWRFKEPLPEYGDIEGMAVYWKNYYNTVKGDGTIEDFIRVYKKYIEGQL